MPTTTDVILITGFLGSGKTTFLNRFIAAFPPERKLMVLMNEFGEIGIDGQLIEGDDLDMLEISKGSIFCVCVKTDFIRGLAQIAVDIRPDMLIIEATGVANPADLKKDLKLSIFQDRFCFKEQVCIIDAENFIDTYDTFTSIERQIETSTLFILNKIDRVAPSAIEAVKNVIRSHLPDPEVYETTYADIPLERLSPLLDITVSDGKAGGAATPQDVESAIEELLDNPQAGTTPPDRLLSAVYLWQGGGRADLEELARQLPQGIVRAKGFIKCANDIFLFSRVMTTTDVIPHASNIIPDDTVNRLVFIGSPEALEQLEALSRDHPCLEKLSLWNPMAFAANQ